MTAAQIAFNRFGLGRRPSDAEPADPRAWLAGQLARYVPGIAGASALAGRAEIAANLGERLQSIAAAARAAPASMTSGSTSRRRDGAADGSRDG